MKNQKTCCIISHAFPEICEKEVKKEYTLSVYEKLKKEILRLINSEKVNFLYFGMEAGAELLAAKYITDKKDETGVFVTCVMPYEEQAAQMEEEQRDIYYSVFEKCDKEIIYKKQHCASCRKDRDFYMMENSDYIIVLNCEKQEFFKTYLPCNFENKEIIFIQ